MVEEIKKLSKQIISKLSETDELAEFFDLCPDLVAITDGKKFIRHNKAWSSILGYSEQDLVDKSLSKLFHPNDRRRALSGIRERCRKKKKGEAFCIKARVKAQDESIHVISFNCSWRGDRCYLIGRDISREADRGNINLPWTPSDATAQ